MSGQELAAAAYNAGFRGDGLVNAIAVGLAESSGNLMANFVNQDGSIDRGPWEFNSRWHPEVSDSCAYDWACSAQAAYRVSGGGADWHEWATWTQGKYKAFLDDARTLAAAASGAPAGSVFGGGAPSSPITSATVNVAGQQIPAWAIAAGVVAVLLVLD